MASFIKCGPECPDCCGAGYRATFKYRMGDSSADDQILYFESRSPALPMTPRPPHSAGIAESETR